MPNWIISKNWQKLSEFFPKKLHALAYFKSMNVLQTEAIFFSEIESKLKKILLKNVHSTLIQVNPKIQFFFNSQKYLRETKERGLFPLPKTVSIFRFFDKCYQCACSFVTHAHLIQLKSWLKLLPVKLSHNILVRFQLGWSGAR